MTVFSRTPSPFLGGKDGVGVDRTSSGDLDCAASPNLLCTTWTPQTGASLIRSLHPHPGPPPRKGEGASGSFISSPPAAGPAQNCCSDPPSDTRSHTRTDA